MSIIYKTINLVNEKIYVGQHQISADNYLGTGKLIKRAIKKYGKENFKREILEHCTSANVNEREIYWIDVLSARDSNIGYNLSVGGGGHSGIKWETKRKKSFSNYMSSVKRNKKWRDNISESLKGIKHKRERIIKNRISNSKYIYILINCENNTIYKNILSLRTFCENHNLNYDCMKSNSKHKNFKIIDKHIK